MGMERAYTVIDGPATIDPDNAQAVRDVVSEQPDACNESPLALTGGRWVSRRGIQVWEAGS